MKFTLFFIILVFGVLGISGQDVKACIEKCIITLNIRPVCGTDGYTYDNLSELECRRNCGMDVRLRHNGPCEHGSKGAPPL